MADPRETGRRFSRPYSKIFAAEQGESGVQHPLVRAVAVQQDTGGVVAPGVDIVAAADQLLEQTDVLQDIHAHASPFYIMGL